MATNITLNATPHSNTFSVKAKEKKLNDTISLKLAPVGNKLIDRSNELKDKFKYLNEDLKEIIQMEKDLKVREMLAVNKQNELLNLEKRMKEKNTMKMDMQNVLECYLIILKNNEELLNRRIEDLKVKDTQLRQKEFILNKVILSSKKNRNENNFKNEKNEKNEKPDKENKYKNISRENSLNSNIKKSYPKILAPENQFSIMIGEISTIKYNNKEKHTQVNTSINNPNENMKENNKEIKLIPLDENNSILQNKITNANLNMPTPKVKKGISLYFNSFDHKKRKTEIPDKKNEEVSVNRNSLTPSKNFVFDVSNAVNITLEAKYAQNNEVNVNPITDSLPITNTNMNINTNINQRKQSLNKYITSNSLTNNKDYTSTKMDSLYDPTNPKKNSQFDTETKYPPSELDLQLPKVELSEEKASKFLEISKGLVGKVLYKDTVFTFLEDVVNCDINKYLQKTNEDNLLNDIAEKEAKIEAVNYFIKSCFAMTMVQSVVREKEMKMEKKKIEEELKIAYEKMIEEERIKEMEKLKEMERIVEEERHKEIERKKAIEKMKQLVSSWWGRIVKSQLEKACNIEMEIKNQKMI